MLLREKGCRHQHRDLLAVLHRLERRAYGDLGLAVADVAADHAVHRDSLLHIGLHLGDGGELIVGLGERERVLHLPLPRAVGREGVPGRGLPRRVQLHQLGRDLANSLARLAFRIRPVRSAELGQARHLPAHVPGELIQRIHRDEQPVAGLAALAGGVLDDQVLAARAADGALDHLDELADAVLVVHDHVPGLQRQRIDLVAAAGGQLLALAGRGDAVAGQVRFGDDDQLGVVEHDAVVQRAAQHPDEPAHRVGAGIQRGGGHLGVGEALQEALRRTVSRDDDHSAAAGGHVRAQRREDGRDQLVGAARGRRGEHRQHHLGRIVRGERAQRPPGQFALVGARVDDVESTVGRGRQVQPVRAERGRAAERGRRPGGLQEFLPGAHEIRGAGADLLRIAQQHVGALGQHLGQQL